jgi:hypothetical protein
MMDLLPLTSANVLTGATVEVESLFGGVHYVITVPNGYGASVINHPHSAGVELAVVGRDGALNYDTPVTGDVLGWLTPDLLADALGQVAAL